MMEVTVAVINYNGIAAVLDTIESILELRGIEPRILVIDDGSTDGSPEAIMENFPEVAVYREPYNTKDVNRLRNKDLRLATTNKVFLTDNDVGSGLTPHDFYGLPTFASASLHSGIPAWELPNDLKEVAREIWSDISEREVELRIRKQYVRTFLDEFGLATHLRRQTESDVEEKIKHDVITARRLLKEHVAPETGNHFCLPYGAGSETSLQVQRELGIQSCSWGTSPETKHNSPGTDPMKLSRAKCDFLWRLSGHGQKSMLRIYREKIQRRLRGGPVY